MGHRYDYEIDLGDGSAPDRVVGMVGRDKRVLDVGAGPGSISRVLSEKFGCRVTAVEVDTDVIPSLASTCEAVHQIDLNDPSWPNALPEAGRFEVVLAADVLEHLYDPWMALRQMKGLIDDNGCIVISLPHAGYCGMLASLLAGDLEYRDSGLMDKTHIRFFGIKNIQALFDDAGLTIVDAQFVIRHPENTEFAEVWQATPATVRMSLLKSRYCLIYQVVVKAVRGLAAGRHTLFQMGAGESDGEVSSPARSATGGAGVKPHAALASEEDEKFDDKIRLIAFFLTQFHPIPENDRWWGKGFTEWTNVTKAEPLFEGHYQPRLPSDLGFYDLRLRQVRHEQIALAKQYGIDGFCYHYYWFSGVRVLEQPLDDMLRDPESDMPFCLCWANENWTRRWDGIDHEVLLGQKHLPEDDLNFIRSVVPFLQDPRYIRLKGEPFLIVYQPRRLPDPMNTVKVWRQHCEAAGVGPIHLCAAFTNDSEDYATLGFDSGVQFPPHNHRCMSIHSQIDFYAPFHGFAVEYSTLARSYLDREYPGGNVFRTVFPSWDQTSRVGSRAFITLNPTPANYEYWLSESIRRTAREFPNQERFVFVNAWNEWAEGCHLEPDQRFGRQFLEATFRAKTGRSEKVAFEDVGRPINQRPPSGRSARLAELEQELARERERLRSLEEELSTERQRISGVYQELSAKRKLVAIREEELSTEQVRRAQLEEQTTRAEQALANLCASRSWRLTRPLRDAVAFIRRGK